MNQYRETGGMEAAILAGCAMATGYAAYQLLLAVGQQGISGQERLAVGTNLG